MRTGVSPALRVAIALSLLNACGLAVWNVYRTVHGNHSPWILGGMLFLFTAIGYSIGMLYSVWLWRDR